MITFEKSLLFSLINKSLKYNYESRIISSNQCWQVNFLCTQKYYLHKTETLIELYKKCLRLHLRDLKIFQPYFITFNNLNHSF